MPPRFRRAEQMATFELVPDDERDDDTSPAASDDTDSARVPLRERAAARWRRLSRRARVGVAATAAVALVAVATAAVLPRVLDGRAQAARAEAVRGLPGAVGDLSDPLTVTWEFTGDTEPLGVLATGALLVGDGSAVSAIDAGTGKETWRQEVGEQPACGPGSLYGALWGSSPVARVVCLGGAADHRVATVLDADGTVVGTRDLGALGDPLAGATEADVPQAWPGPDGTVALLDPSPGVSVPISVDEPGEAELRALRAAGWVDPTLHLQDALTGEVRGEVSAPLEAGDLESCGTLQDEDGATELMLAPQVSTSATLVELQVCGASVGISPDGAVVDRGDTYRQSRAGGGEVALGESSTYFDATGTEIATVRGWAQTPWLDDEPDGAFLTSVTGRDGAARLVATDRDGTQLWARPADDDALVVARVGGVLVVEDGEETIGVDARTGARRWSVGELLDISDDASSERVAGAVTDGTRLLLGITGDGLSSGRLVALDVRDGSVAWRTDLDTGLGLLRAVGGHPVMLSPSWMSARGLG